VGHPKAFFGIEMRPPPFKSKGAATRRSRLAIRRVSRYYLDMLRFDWDERKNKRNRAKHGVWFEEAQSVFSDPHARLFYDPEHSEGFAAEAAT
jgi:hypothetical protein